MRIAPFVPTPIQVVRQMLILAELAPEEKIFDLGSGDGRIVLMAAQEFGAVAVGVEMREDLARQSLKKVSDLNLERRVKIVHDDLFKIKVDSADIVTLYLTTIGNEKIKPKLESELKPGARIVSHDIKIAGWKPHKIVKFREKLSKRSSGFGFLSRTIDAIRRYYLPTHTLYLYKR